MTPEIIDQINELILEDHRISAQSIAEHLGISRERVISIIHEDSTMRKLSAKRDPKCLNAKQKRQRYQSCEQHLEFFRRDPNDVLSGAIGDNGRNMVMPLLPGDKATINGVAAWLFTPPQQIPSAKIRWKISSLPRFFLDQDGILLIDYLPKAQTMNAEYYSTLLV
jgi:hypothetical protein